MSTFQVAAILFALFIMYTVSIQKRKRVIATVEASFWYSTWAFFIVIAVFPNLLLGLAGALKFARVFDFLVVIAFMILSLLAFYSYFMIKQLEKKLEQVSRSVAIKATQKRINET